MIDPVVLRKNINQELETELNKLQKCLVDKIDRSLTEAQLDKVIAKLSQALYLDLLVVQPADEKKLQEEFKETVGRLSLAVEKAYAS